MNVLVVNEATNLAKALGLTGLTDDQAGTKLAWALNYQARWQFGRSGWRSDVRCGYLAGGGSAVIPVGAMVLHLLDNLDVQGALGYHDEDGNEVPYARVGIQTTLQDQGSISEVCSHELLELAVDPHVNLSALTGRGDFLFALEVGDPVQGNAYDVGAPDGKTTGIQVADFVLPNYFDPNTKTSTPTSYRKSIKGPFSLGSQGYYSYIDMSNVRAGWQQKVGSEHKGPLTPDKDDRVLRRGTD